MDKIILIFKLIPAIMVAIQAIEEAIPGQGEGEKKLEAVRQMLSAVDSGVGALWPQIAGVVSTLVTLFNQTGWGKGVAK